MEQALSIQELVEACVGYICDDQKSLKYASMVNRVFYASCAPHIFRSITLRFGRRVPRTNIPGPSIRALPLYHLLNRSPHIGRLVQELRIHGNFNGFPQTVGESGDTYLHQIFSALPSLSSIELQHLVFSPGFPLRGYGDWELLPSSLANSLNSLLKSPNLRTVHFKHLVGIPIHLLHSSHNVKNIQMVWALPTTQTHANDDGTPATSTNRPQVESLSYGYSSLTKPPISQFLQPDSPLDLSNLKTFNGFICIGDPAQQSALSEFLLPIRTSIENLGLRAWGAQVGTIPDPLDLGTLESLRSLNFTCKVMSHVNNPLAWVNHHLGKFVSPNQVEEITLTLKVSPEVFGAFRDASGPAWEAMDSIVHKASLPRLRVFSVHFHEKNPQPNDENLTDFMAAIPLRMSRLRDRGIVSVKPVTVVPPGLAFIDDE